MRCITLTQPYATLIAIGAKKIETRSWSTSYRGPLAIHAAKGFPNSAKMLCEARSVCRILGWPECPDVLTQIWLDDNARRIKTLPVGCVLATCNLVGCVSTGPYGFASAHLPSERVFPGVPVFNINNSLRIAAGAKIYELTDQERAFGNYEPWRYAWILGEVQALPEPIPARGWLSLWEWEPPEQETKVTR